MTDASDFLAAIIDHPDDDLPRLVFADYLDERGEPERAEFIRVQCELARLPQDHDDRPWLVRREAKLHEAHRHEWRLPKLRGYQGFRRGFVEVIATTAERLLAAETVFERMPVRDLRIANVDAHVEPLSRLAGLRHIESLNLRANNLGAGGRLEQLFTEGRFDRLTRLNLQNNRLWPESLEPFINTPVAAQLTELHLSGNPLTDVGLAILAEAPALAHLSELVFRSDEQSIEDSIRAPGAEALAASSTLTNLSILNLSGHFIGYPGLVSLVNWPSAARLVDLDVSYNNINAVRDRGLEDLVESPFLGNLKRINLAGIRMTSREVEQLLKWPRLREGLQVDLRDADLILNAGRLIVHSEFAGQIQMSELEQESV